MKIDSEFFKNESEFNEERKQRNIISFVITELGNGEILATTCRNVDSVSFMCPNEIHRTVQSALVQIHAAVLSGYLSSGGLVKAKEYE